MNKSIEIDRRTIGLNAPPYIIAELSANHNSDIDRAFGILEAARNAGADAVKLQTYRADTLTIDHDSKDFQLSDGLWAGQTLYQLYEKAHMPWEWHVPLFERAKQLGITLFSSPFDTTAVDLLEDLNAPAYKIASFEVVDLELIRYTASTLKPLIISTGLASEEEVQRAVDTATQAGCQDLVLLHCVSAYPAKASDYNLHTLVWMREKFGCLVGLSDHTIGNETALAATALGACVVEKHFTLDRSGGGPDDSFSLEPDELAELVAQSRATVVSKEALSAPIVEPGFKRSAAEQDSKRFRRSLYFVRDKATGDTVRPDDVRCIRPGYGLEPRYLDTVIGSTLACDVKYGLAVEWQHLEGIDAKDQAAE
jgi:N-acetylneuraminate synthase